MKKFMMLLAAVAVATTAMAQGTTEVPTRKYHVVTNNFWANWYIQAGFNVNATYTSQEKSGLSGNPFTGTRGDLGFEVAIGKWFTPGIGLRTKFNGLWAKDVLEVGHDAGNRPARKYFNIQEDVMFNLTNLIGGYKENRVWNISVYPGFGYIRNFSKGQVNADYSLNLGIINTFRLAKHWNIYLDVWGTAAEGSLLKNGEGKYHEWRKLGDDSPKTYSRYWDKFLNASIGVTYNLGKCTWDVAPDVDALMAMNQEQIDALNAALKDQQDENARLRDLLANQKPAQPEKVVQTVKELVSTSASVFFNLDKTNIASRKDLVNVQEIAKYAIDNNSKLIVTGYADSKTGGVEHNQWLSEERAKTVVNELVKMGVKKENIESVAAGGVDILNPYSYNRRATVKVAE